MDKNRSNVRFGFIVVYVAVLAGLGWGQYSGGMGTEGDPFRIGTVADWIALGENTGDYDKHFILTAHLDFGGAEIGPVGRYFSEPAMPFTGALDGDGYVLKNFKMSNQNLAEPETHLGLFAYLDGAVIQNLGLVDFEIVVNPAARNVLVGGLAATIGEYPYQTHGGLIENCYAAGTIVTGYTYGTLGGLVGINNGGEIKRCYSDCDIWMPEGATASAGALAGSVYGDGLLVRESFWNRDKFETGIKNVIGLHAGKDIAGLSSELMQERGPFAAKGWDFVGEAANGIRGIWHMPWGGGGAPMLWNQKDIPGDVAGAYGVDLIDYGYLALNWLGDDGGYGGDGIVDLDELALTAENWLAPR